MRKLLREQRHVRQGPARPTIVSVRRVVHWATLRGQIRLRVHSRWHRRHGHIPHSYRAVRVDDMR